MDDPVSVLRMVERIVAVCIGGLGIYLGYRLFFHLPFERGDKGEITLPGIKIVLSRVGPGVFFAAFGSAVLYHSMTEEVKVSREIQQSAAADGASETVSEAFVGASRARADGGDAARPQQRARVLAAIETLNCAEQLAAGQGQGLHQDMALAVREAKRALLLTIWNSDDWGPPERLAATGPAEDAPFELRRLLAATRESCPG